MLSKVTLDMNNSARVGSRNNIAITEPKSVFGKKQRGDGTAHVDGVIDYFEQGEAATNCVSLAELVGLSYTPLGKNAIKNSVKPDGMGGAIVTFKGAKGNQKEFRISVEEFNKYGNYEIYTKGDDDVLCIELAMVKYLKSIGYNMSYKGWKLDYYSIEELSEHGLIGLLMGDENVIRYKLHDIKDMERGLAEFEKNLDRYVLWSSFLEYCHIEDGEEIVPQHAYAIKRIDSHNGEKYIILTNPYNSTKELKMKYSDFIFASKLEFKMYQIDSNEVNRDLAPCGARSLEKAQNDKVEAGLNETKWQNHFGKVHFLYTKYQEFTEMIDFADDNKLKQYIDNLSDLERYFIMKNSADIFIDKLDHRYRGWKNEDIQNKKNVIRPFISSIIKHAQLYGVSNTDINKFQSVCTRELNNRFYTNESKIIESFKEFIEIVEKAKEEYYKDCRNVQAHPKCFIN